MKASVLVDSHCHVSPLWYEPVEALLHQMTRAGVSHAVLIQMIAQCDNRYQQDCLKRFPGHFASVVWVDPNSSNAVSDLRRLVDEGAAGVRLRPLARSPGVDPLAIWRCAESCGIAVSCVGNSSAFVSAEFALLVSECPNLIIVLEHLGDTSNANRDEAARTQHVQVMELARFANIYLKIPGLGELMARKSPLPPDGTPFESATPEILLRAIDAFGPQRLMWGSDFPPVSSREGYGNSLELVRQALRHLSQEDLAAIFGDVARAVFKLPVLDAHAEDPR